MKLATALFAFNHILVIFATLGPNLTAFSADVPHLPNKNDPGRNLVIITDMEPDDRIALAIVAARMPHRVLCIGTTVLNAARKAELARHAVAETELAGVKVYAGTGKSADEYPEMRSTKAAKVYGDKEGKGILDEETLSKFIGITQQDRPNEFQPRLEELLSEALDQKVPIDILAVAPPTDLVEILDHSPVLKGAIGRIYLMGGWVEVRDKKGEVIRRRSTYNVNMDGGATARLLEMASREEVQVILYSSHVIEAQFEGGSVNRKHFPNLIEAITKSEAPGLRQFRTAGFNWDTNLVKNYERLRKFVEPFAGEQFTPSDPLPVIGILNPNLDKSKERVKIKVEMPKEGEPTPEGYTVHVSEDESSGITLVTEFDMDMFRKEMMMSIESIDRYEKERQKKAELGSGSGNNPSEEEDPLDPEECDGGEAEGE